MKGLITEAREFPLPGRNARTQNVAVLEAGEKERLCATWPGTSGIRQGGPSSGRRGHGIPGQWAETPPRELRRWSPAMAVHQGTPPVLTSSAVWVFLGATAPHWPGQVRIPLLNDDRKGILHDSLGPGAEPPPLVPEKRKQREALFRRPPPAPGSCAFVRPLADGSGRPLPPPPFVTEAEAGTSPPAYPGGNFP